MRICYVTPGLGPCGGVRVIGEHCSRLAERGHLVVLAAPRSMIRKYHRGQNDLGWYRLQEDVILSPYDTATSGAEFDVVVATGYQTVVPSVEIPGKEYFYFVQMMEYLFSTPNTKAYHDAKISYDFAVSEGFRFITIANWLQETLEEEFDAPSIIVPNGVNKSDFFPVGDKKEAIIIEGDDRNPAKDVDHLSWRVGRIIREEYGIELWGYAAYRHSRASELDRFFVKPTTRNMREIYSGAKFLLKASKYEGRGCAPVEAMCCGTPTIRAITSGDDDVIDMVNSLRREYDFRSLLDAARSVMDQGGLLAQITIGAKKYADKNLNWSDKIDLLESIYETVA